MIKPENMNPWKTLDEQEVYNNPWIRITHRNVINPSGGKGIYGVVHFKNLAIGIVPVDEQGNTWLVGQYRYTLNQYSWEIPEGGCPIGTDPLLAAKRELKEETGIIANTWTKILDVHTSNSVTDETGIIYLASDLTFGEAEPEDTEDLMLKKLPLAQAIEMVYQGKITDLMAVSGLLRAKLLLDI